jgi:small subunit ribosomal protein S9
MADDERQDDAQPTEGKTSAEEEAPAEETPAEETPAEEQAPAEDAPAEEEAPAEEAPAEGEEQEDEAAAEEAAPEATPETPASEEPGEKPKAKDQPPGAELDPIALEPDRPLSAEERARAEAEAEERAKLEAAETDDGTEEPLRSGPAVELDADTLIQATGKRKSAIARVVLRQGSGTFQVNSRSLEDYFPRHQHQAAARQPLVTAGYEGAVDVRVRVQGGGVSGQAGAVRHGVARALTEVDPELRTELKRRGFLTRDARIKERRKAGLKKARKRPQFSKR